MKLKLLSVLIGTLIYLTNYAQLIPYGDSKDSVLASDGYTWEIYYYKSPGYDSLNSPILWGIHGQGMNGNSEIGDLRAIADRKKALIVSPTFQSSSWVYAQSGSVWLPNIFKELYHHVLSREKRDSIWVYMIGFSAGGQCVTRYMLIRQAIVDSIPIRMAVSASPYYYTFCTDSLNGISMNYPCGIKPNHGGMDFICNEHVIQYYNENYGVLIGTSDIASVSGEPCINIQGANRYERAKNFYAFSDSNAVNRGTTLKWQYAEVSGVGHNQNQVYNTKASPTDTSTIAETLLFNSPYYPPTNFPPSADFIYKRDASVSCTTVNFTALCRCQTEPVNFFWDFGDGDTSNIPVLTHTYDTSGNYTVSLTVTDTFGNIDVQTKNIYVGNDLHITGSFNIAFGPNPVCPGSSISFYCYNCNADSYLWDFGDSTTATNSSEKHTYLSEGIYPISVTLSKKCHIDTTVYDTIYVENGLPITGSFSTYISHNFICYDGRVHFGSNGGNELSTYLWNFGDSTYSSEKKTTHIYDSLGTYPVSLTIGICGSDTTLFDTIYVQDNVEPELWWEYWPSKDEACINDTIEFWGWSIGGRYFWNFGDDDTTSVTTEKKTSYGWVYDVAKHVYSTPGNYTVSFTYTTNCGSYVDSFNVLIGSIPIADFIAVPTIVSLPNATVQFYNNSVLATSYLWDFGDSTTSTDTNPTYTYLYADTFTVTLTASNGMGCDNKIIKQDYIIVKNYDGIQEIPNKVKLSLYPNPFTDYAKLYVDLEYMKSRNNVSIEIYDYLGRVVRKTENIKNTPYIIERGTIDNGIYIYKVISENEVVGKGKLMIY